MTRRFVPPDVLEVSDPDAGLTGWLAVDSVVDGHFCGGLRMLPDVSAPELAVARQGNDIETRVSRNSARRCQGRRPVQ